MTRTDKITIARFQSGLNLDIRNEVELLLCNDLNELVQLCVRIEQQLKKKICSENILPPHNLIKSVRVTTTPFQHLRMKDHEIRKEKEKEKKFVYFLKIN